MAHRWRSRRLAFVSLTLLLLHALCTVQQEDMRLSCRTAPSDLVFILDGSWSVGDTNFEIVKRWLVNITTSFNIGQKFTHLGLVQYSDDPHLEIPLGRHYSSKALIEAMESIEYMGGNTRTGKAIQFASDRLFATSERAPNGVAKIAVVLTDGKSQDEVAAVAEAAREKGIILFAIGVGEETEEAELKAIANKPHSTYVFYVEDYIAISKIREVIRQKLCEETVCPERIPVNSRDEKGFDILVHLDLAKKAKKTQGSYYGTKAYEVTSRVDLSESTRSLFPDGLPPSYVFVATLKYKGSVTKEKWDLWRVQTQEEKPQMAVTLNGIHQTVMFTTTSKGSNGTQTVVFTKSPAKKLFDEQWHQLRLLVTEADVTLYVDNLEIESLALEPPLGIFINGQTQVGKYVSKETTVPFEIQKLRIYCDPEQNNRETACEIPGVDGECVNGPGDFHPTPEPCTCPAGPPGMPGLKGEPGRSGHSGQHGPAGAEGKPGIPGVRGHSGPQGPSGIQGPRGETGYNGEKGETGDSGKPGVPGLPGLQGQPGEKGSTGPRGVHGLRGEIGHVGEKGSRGPMGTPGYRGTPGQPGLKGKDGDQGNNGEKGEAGKPGIPGSDGRAGHPGMSGLPGNEGLQGDKGEAGSSGDKGSRGSAGPPGVMGSTGMPGASGKPGSKGSKGESGQPGKTGLPGLQGKPGDPGMAGQPGHSGRPGMKGHKGDRGDHGQRGSEGTKGEKGDKGMAGGQGSSGVPGQRGEKGTSGDPGVRGQNGHQGPPGQPGQTGPSGPRGLSGDVGPAGPSGLEGRPGREMSEQHIRQICRDVLRMEFPLFLESSQPRSCDHCQSRAGSTGPQGQPGPVGPQGSRGFPGMPGSSGLQGHPGLPGLPGVAGIKGDAGEVGEKGSQGRTQIGDQGLPGLQGLTGPPGTGKPGYPGKPGPAGPNGVEGKRGNPGVPGQPGVCHPSLCYGAMMRRDPFRKGPNY